MSNSKNLKEFPDLSNKLTAPKKQSLFERQKAEAEAKKLREEAETAAVYEDFVKSFEDGGEGPPGSNDTSRGRGGFSAEPRGPSGPPKRHFTSSMSRQSGPGSLGPPSLPRKRALDGSRIERDIEKGIFAFDDSQSSGPLDAATAFKLSDDEDEKVDESKASERLAAKPTLQLSSLPPGTSISVIKTLFPEKLVVDSVVVVPPSGPGPAKSLERKSMSAIVAFAQDTPASELDAAVSILQNKYLGWGYNLSLSRHLSSAALSSINNSTNSTHSALASLPFGAQAIPTGPGPSLSRAPPPSMHRGGYAPPSSYGQPEAGQFGRGVPPMQVKVVPPTDMRQLKLIHKTVEAVMSHGAPFEALLMSRPEVQRDEKWAWIWNPRSSGGVWYRWRLWQLLAGSAAQQSRRLAQRSHEVFKSGVPWLEPEVGLPFEFTTEFEDLASASDYDSSDEEDSDEEGGPRKRRHFTGGPVADDSALTGSDEQSYLNPLHKAKLIHLLARLPTTTGRLRKGDVARVTAFAIIHAGRGADEVVEILISNVLQPFSCSQHANRGIKDDDVEADADGGEVADTRDHEETLDRREIQQDPSSSTLIGLYLISDILSASSTSGVRHAWRYRSQFEAALQSRHIFAYLGRMEKDCGWGRLRAEKWRRSINGVLQLWEGWCVFSAASHEQFAEQFNNPPLTDQEATLELERKAEKAGVRDPAKSKWKSVELNTGDSNTAPVAEQMQAMDVDGEPMIDEDIDGVPMDGSDGEPMEDVDGEPMNDAAEEHVDQDMGNETLPAVLLPQPGHNDDHASQQAKRRRPKAEDMFADSDDD